MLSVVLPAYNEEGAIQDTLDTLNKVLAESNIEQHEIVVVDDGSADRTGEIAAAAGATVIRNPHNMGYGFSLKRGIQEAGFDTILIIDADLTYPVSEIPRLLEEYQQGFDMVVGARTGEHYHGTFLKNISRRILKSIVEFTAGREIPDINSGMRVFSRTTILDYFKQLCDTFSFTTSLTIAYMMTGKFVRYVPIDYHERAGVTHVRIFSDSLRTLQFIAQCIVYYNPIKLFILLSGLCMILAILSFVIGYASGLNAPYYLGIGSVLVALLVFCLGMMADLLRQIMAK